jgi:SAM-dependent methyltransferase
MDPLTPSVVLAAYAEPLLEGRRIVVFGDATSPLADELVGRGARAVHVYDPEPRRAAEAAGRNRSRQISVVPLDDADVAVRDATFDVAIIDDLTAVPDPALLVKRARRALLPRGVAIVASPNPEARFAMLPRASAGRGTTVGYYDLYDAVSAEFPEVRMFGQTPFVGYAVVDFAPEGEPEVGLDSGLVPGGAEEPEWFIALASEEAVELDALSVVQLPAGPILGSGGADLAGAVRAARTAESRLSERVAELEAENADLRAKQKSAKPDVSRERLTELERALEASRAELERALEASRTELERALEASRAELGKRNREVQEARAELERKRAALDEKDAFIAEIESRSAATDARAEQVAQELEASRKAAAAAAELEKQVAALVAEKLALGAEKASLAAALAEKEAELDKLVRVSAEEAPEDLAKLEAALKERGEQIRKLEADLREAERVGKELVREMARLNGRSREPSAAPAETGGAGAALATENARLRADLEAAGWTIEELEERLGRALGGDSERAGGGPGRTAPVAPR